MIKVNGLGVSRIPINGKETLWVMRNGQQLWSGTGLPAGYTLLEYIESLNGQYIDTGLYGNQNTSVLIDALLVGFASGTTSSLLFGSLNDSTKAISINPSTQSAWSRFGSTYVDGGFTIAVGSRNVFGINKNNTTLNGNVTHTWGDISSFTTAGTMHLCKCNGNSNVSKWRIYSCQIYDNGVLIRDLIPCKNPSGVYGLYDKVNKQFYGSASSTPFTGA